jgi:hypothetical protein
VIEADVVAIVIWNNTQTTPKDLAGRSKKRLPTLPKLRVFDHRLAPPNRTTSFGVSVSVLVTHREAPDFNGAEFRTSVGEG